MADTSHCPTSILQQQACTLDIRCPEAPPECPTSHVPRPTHMSISTSVLLPTMPAAPPLILLLLYLG